MHEVGKCPECGGTDIEVCHETMNGGELWIWEECAGCKHQFVEVFRRDRIERWEEFR